MTPLSPPPGDSRDWTALTADPLPVETLVAWATTPACGAVVTFLGVVRDHAEGRRGIRSMSYEAYEEQAERALREVVAEARRRRPDTERVALVHRTGDIDLSEASVAVVVSSAHRDAAFDTARFCIDTLKETVPIWKQEHWEGGGTGWAVDDHPIRRVSATEG